MCVGQTRNENYGAQNTELTRKAHSHIVQFSTFPTIDADIYIYIR